MLMMLSSSTQGKLEVLGASALFETHCGPWEIMGLITILT